MNRTDEAAPNGAATLTSRSVLAAAITGLGQALQENDTLGGAFARIIRGTPQATDSEVVPSIGWRFWTVLPGEDLLRSPHTGAVWPEPEFHAVCEIDPNHEPPEPGCICAVYADRTLRNTRVQYRMVQGYQAAGKLAVGTIVIGRVQLSNAVQGDPPDDNAILVALTAARHWELRAASARIIDLAVVRDENVTDDAETLARTLAARYEVPVSVETPKPRTGLEAMLNATFLKLCFLRDDIIYGAQGGIAAEAKQSDVRADGSSALLHVSFICTYNRARSVTAAVIFAEHLRRRGLADVVRVSSAGTAPDIGSPADPRAARVLASRGFSVPQPHRATLVSAEHLAADLVVAMGAEHVDQLVQLGVGPDRIGCLSVKNPCYGDDFEHAYIAIAAAMPGLHAWVDQRLAPNV